MLLVRAVVGLALAMLVAWLAHRARALSRSGVAAATAVGALAVIAGDGWAALLVAYFVASSLLSRVGAARKAARTDGIVAKSGARDARQVLANGGVFALLALGHALSPREPWALAAVGALAAAAADTWATELGTLYGGTPRSIVTLRPVPAGTSGGITLVGTLGGLAGAGFVAAVARLGGFPAASLLAAITGGTVGMLADSLAGATLQARRRCVRCAAATERAVHACGSATEPAGGLAWLDNDAVNVLCALTGAAVGLAVSR